MEYLISLAVAALFVALCYKSLKRRSTVWYIVAVLLAAAAVAVPADALPLWVQQYVLGLFRRGYLATALFVAVMWIGTLKNGGKLMKALYPVRSELSVFAGILMLGHMIACFLPLFSITLGSLAAPRKILNAALSCLTVLIFLPLWITSFPCVRKRMKAAAWKKLQRLAYVFYTLSYVHMMLVVTPYVLIGSVSALAAALTYSAVWLLYAGLRLRKACGKWWVVAVSVLVLVALCAALGFGYLQNRRVTAESGAVVSQWKDGTWRGSGFGYRGNVTVDVTVADGAITAVDVVSSWDDGRYFNAAKSGVIAAILAGQTTDVDAVSGASFSSWGIMDAVQNALDQAAVGG